MIRILSFICQQVLMTNYPTLIPATRTLATVTLPGGGIQFPALFSPDSATAQARSTANNFRNYA